MLKQSNTFLSSILFSLIFLSVNGENSNPEVSSSSDIKPDCSIKVEASDNYLEKLLDYIYKYNTDSDFWVSTPDRAVPLIQVRKTNDGKVMYLTFKIPHRIDMDPKYSKQINEAVNTRQELPFAAYNAVRNIVQEETVDIKFSEGWTLYHARFMNAGKYGYFVCYNSEQKNNKDCGCMPIEEFIECLKFYKPNEKQQEETR